MYIKTDFGDVIVLSDQTGNIYFDYNGELYEIMITHDNKIELDKVCSMYEKVTTKLNKLKVIKKTLRDKINKIKKTDETVEQEEKRYNSDEDTDEEKEYLKEDEEVDIEIENEDEVNLFGEIDILNMDYETEPPMYDTIVYVNETPIFKTVVTYIGYRLVITNDKITFRAIGEKEYEYKFKNDNNKLCLFIL